MDPIHADLIRQAADAARSGDRDTARQLLEEVLEEDDTNIQAWLLLARVTDSVDERRMALTTVMQLDPNNEHAQQMLNRMDGKADAPEEEIIPGISRSQFRLIVIGIGSLVAVMIILFVVITISRNNREASQHEAATRQAAEGTAAALEATGVQETNTQVAADRTATLFAEFSPTPTEPPTSSAPTLPPTITPTSPPSPTPTLAPVEGIPGRLVMWGGRDLSGRGVLPMYIYDLEGGGELVQIGEENGREVTFSPDGQQLLYTAYFPTGGHVDVVLIDLEAQPIESIIDTGPALIGYSESEMGSFSANGERVVFIGEIGAGQREIVIAALSDDPVDGDLTITQLTDDSAEYSYPTLSPDGTQVVAIRKSNSLENPGTDLVLIDVESRTLTPLTTDGDALIETTARWSPDGSLIAYAATTSDERDNDIYLIAPNNPGNGFRPEAMQSPGDDKYPVFSPDGRFLAFASNRGGTYDLYIYNLAAQSLVQLTDNQEDLFPGGWAN